MQTKKCKIQKYTVGGSRRYVGNEVENGVTAGESLTNTGNQKQNIGRLTRHTLRTKIHYSTGKQQQKLLLKHELQQVAEKYKKESKRAETMETQETHRSSTK